MDTDLSATGQSSTPAADISWMMLDRFVFTSDLGDFVADPREASSETSLGECFTVGLRPAAPPTVSRLYVEWASEGKAIEVVTADRGVFLLRVTTCTKVPHRQDYFVYRPAPISVLKRLPACIEPIVLPLGDSEIRMQRMFHNNTLSLVSNIISDDEFEFAVFQLAKIVNLDIPGNEMAEICRFSSSSSVTLADGCVEVDGMWQIQTVRVIHPVQEELPDLRGWSTNGAIVWRDCTCWFDYYSGGILMHNHRQKSNLMTYTRLPINDRPTNSLPTDKHLEMYRSLCLTAGGDQLLMFVDVARDDRSFYGPLRKGSTFTITCHSLGPYGWHKDPLVVTSRDIYLDGHKSLMPRNSAPTFPLVSRDMPHLLHFLMSEPRKKGKTIDKVSVVTIDVVKKTVVSVTPYIQGDEDLCSKDAEMVTRRSRLPWSFLPFQL